MKRDPKALLVRQKSLSVNVIASGLWHLKEANIIPRSRVSRDFARICPSIHRGLRSQYCTLLCSNDVASYILRWWAIDWELECQYGTIVFFFEARTETWSLSAGSCFIQWFVGAYKLISHTLICGLSKYTDRLCLRLKNLMFSTLESTMSFSTRNKLWFIEALALVFGRSFIRKSERRFYYIKSANCVSVCVQTE